MALFDESPLKIPSIGVADFALAGPIASSRGLSREFAKYLTCLSSGEADECCHLAAQNFVTLLGNSALAKRTWGGAIAPPFVNWFKKW